MSPWIDPLREAAKDAHGALLAVVRLPDLSVSVSTPRLAALLGRKDDAVIGATLEDLGLRVLEDPLSSDCSPVTKTARSTVEEPPVSERAEMVLFSMRTPRESLGLLFDLSPRFDLVDADEYSELLRAETRWRTLVETLPAITYLDAAIDERVENVQETESIYLSPQVKDILGYDRKDFPTLSSWDAKVHPEDRPFVHAAEKAADKTGGYSLDYRMTAKDGSVVWVHDESVAVRDPVDGRVYWQGVISDITQLRETERLARERAAAERANREKSEFLSRMSHELRTPLNAVLGFGQLLEMDSLDETQHENVQQILSAGRHLLELVNEVLDINRIEVGTLQASVEPVRLGEIVAEAVHLVVSIAKEADVRIVAEPTEIWSRRASADPQRLSQVLLDLLDNGIKYNRAGGTLTVTCEAGGGRLRIVVHDTGYGIPPERIGAIWAPFDRLNPTVDGTGLGLTLSKRLTEAMGGTLSVQSDPGKGSTFTIDLPEATEPA